MVRQISLTRSIPGMIYFRKLSSLENSSTELRLLKNDVNQIKNRIVALRLQ